MHHIYHTEGIILGSRNYGEAGKYFYIFTKELGLIFASAQGIRKLSSKLRFTLQDFSYVNVDLVRGKDLWRVTTATKNRELENLVKNPVIFPVLVSLTKLLQRLLAGEEKNETLFLDLIRGLKVLENKKNKEEVNNVEVLLVLRILHHLGYVGGADLVDNCATSPLEEDLVYQISQNRTQILNHINKALRETQL